MPARRAAWRAASRVVGSIPLMLQGAAWFICAARRWWPCIHAAPDRRPLSAIRAAAGPALFPEIDPCCTPALFADHGKQPVNAVNLSQETPNRPKSQPREIGTIGCRRESSRLNVAYRVPTNYFDVHKRDGYRPDCQDGGHLRNST